MNGRMASPAKRLQVAQRIVAGVSGAAPSAPTAVPMMDSKVIIGSAALTPEPISLQSLLSIAAKVVVVLGLSDIAVVAFLRCVCHRATQYFRALYRDARRTARLRSLVVNVISTAIGALVCRSDNTRAGLSAAFLKLFNVVSGADNWTTRSTYLLNRAGRFINSRAFVAVTIAHPVMRLPMRCQSTRITPLSVWRIPDHSITATRANYGSVSSWCHTPYCLGR